MQNSPVKQIDPAVQALFDSFNAAFMKAKKDNPTLTAWTIELPVTEEQTQIRINELFRANYSGMTLMSSQMQDDKGQHTICYTVTDRVRSRSSVANVSGLHGWNEKHKPAGQQPSVVVALAAGSSSAPCAIL